MPEIRIPEEQPSVKPRSVLYAEYALWALTAWICAFGICQTLAAMPEIERAIEAELHGAFAVTERMLTEFIVGGYAFFGLLSAWVVVKVGDGKKWARASVLWSFVVELICMVVPPYKAPLDYLADAPDFILQAYAIYVLYTWPAKGWFGEKKKLL